MIEERAEEPQKLLTVFAINQALDQAMAKDDSVIVMGEDVSDPTGGGVFKATMGLSTKYGEHRVRATPISEVAIVGAAIGAGIGGFRPVAEIMFNDFSAVCMDQISNHAAKLRYMSGVRTNVPITIRMAAGGGMQFGAQHSEMLEAWFFHIPGLKVAIASCPADAKGLLTTCIFDDDPCIHLEPSLSYFVPGLVPPGEHALPLGKADIKRPGKDASIITYGREVGMALAVADQLAGEGIDLEVLDLRWISPLDEAAILASVAKTKRAIVFHQAVRRGGVGAEIAAMLNEELFGELSAPVLRVAAPNVPIPYARELEQAYLPGPDDLLEGVRRLFK
jgi:pyruvate/2-oxoglutarate/acetoin dehydrogenase E1 component